jgi:hypothetical protein
MAPRDSEPGSRTRASRTLGMLGSVSPTGVKSVLGARGSCFFSCVRFAGLAAFGMLGTLPLGLVGTLALEGTAHAQCSPPTADIVWTYPDERTTSVPPAAVLWAVIDGGGTVAVEVDGVALAPLDAGPIEKHQFVPEAPLAPASTSFSCGPFATGPTTHPRNSMPSCRGRVRCSSQGCSPSPMMAMALANSCRSPKSSCNAPATRCMSRTP